MTVNQETFGCTSTAWEPTANKTFAAGDRSASEIAEIAGVLIAFGPPQIVPGNLQ